MLTFPPDVTFLIQLVAFFGLLFVLARLLFAPFLDLLDERAARTVGDAAAAAEQTVQAQALAARIDEELAKVRAQTMSEVDAMRRQTKEEEREIFARAQADAAGRLGELRSSVAAATAEARQTLAGDARALADQMVAAVLGKGSNA
ncbi:MAG TPA: ATP synthase F0 subunit B [Candidatus Limnocylindrales bacterium]|nr:ATP synthase F0 subunit B [Candidatus Limnocylindrales bacterium]